MLSSGGDVYTEPMICRVATIPKNVNNKLWERNCGQVAKEISQEEVLELIPRDIIIDSMESITEELAMEGESEIHDNCSDISNNSSSSQNAESNILKDMLTKLCKVNRKEIWK